MVDVSRLLNQLGGDQAEWAVRYRYDGPLYTHKLCLDENGAVYLWSKHRDESGVHAAVWHGRDREYDIPHSVDLDQMKCNLDEITNLCQRIHDGLSVDWNGSNNVGTLSEDALQAEEELRELLVDVNNQHHYEIAGEDCYADVVPEMAQKIREGKLTRDEAMSSLLWPVTEDDVTILADYNAVDALDSELAKGNTNETVE